MWDWFKVTQLVYGSVRIGPKAAARASTDLCFAALVTVPDTGAKAGRQVLKHRTF